MLTISRISTYQQFADIKDEWDALISKSEMDNIFLTHEWIGAYIRHFCTEQDLLILIIRNSKDIIGIAPLMIRNYKYFGLPVRCVCFIGTDISDRMDLVFLDNKEEEGIDLALEYLMDMKRYWDYIDLQEMSEYTGTMQAIKQWVEKKGILNILGPSKKSFFIAFNGDKDFLFQRFSKKFQRALKKLSNNHIMHTFEFNRYFGGDVRGEVLFSKAKSVEDCSWKAEKNSGIFSNERTRNFHKEILDKFSENRWIDFSIMTLYKRPIAYIYNYLYGKRSYNYNIAFDKKYSNMSPGTMLMLWTLKDTASRGILEFDFARGDGDWKSRFTDDFRIHNRIRIFKDGIYQRLIYCLQAKIMPYMREKKALHGIWMKIKGAMRWN